MKVVLVMERLMNLFTEWYKILSPSFPSPEVGIFGIKLEPIPVCQTMKHGIDHVVQLNEEPTVNASMIDEPFPERLIHSTIVTNLHQTHFEIIIFLVSIS